MLEWPPTYPFIGYSVETMENKNYSFTIWDIAAGRSWWPLLGFIWYPAIWHTHSIAYLFNRYGSKNAFVFFR